MNKLPTIYLKRNKEDSLLRFHPWVFSGAVGHVNGEPREGDLVCVRSSSGEALGVGHYQQGSIVCRILEFFKEDLPDGFYRQRISEAYRMRRGLGLVSKDNDTYRLVHGEGDFLPGLVADVYGDTAVVQAHSAGMHRDRRLVTDAILEAVPEVKNVYYKSEGTLPFRKSFDDIEDGYLLGGQSSCLARENGLTFSIDWLRGQKTGFFIDQRENRSLVERYSRGKKVLNMFCYTGGFSVYAMRGGATSVTSVDSSEKAVELVTANMQRNFPGSANHTEVCEDAFRFLDSMAGDYDLVILDPPAFAKHRDAIRNALQGYRRLNAKALEKIHSGGLLFTFSCSQAIDKDMFRLAVFSAAAMTGRRVRILHQLHQPQDHPINIYHPEGEYLKGLVLEVE